MTTKVSNSTDMRQALNENLSSLLNGRRKPPIVKEVNNTLGKMLSDVKMELMNNSLAGKKVSIQWFEKNTKPTKTAAKKK